MSLLEMLRGETNDTLPEHYRHLSVEEMENRVRVLKEKFGNQVYIPGHHYQKDEVIQFADDVGDSLQLAQMCEQTTQAKYIVFCGVHFMAETADILTREDRKSTRLHSSHVAI